MPVSAPFDDATTANQPSDGLIGPLPDVLTLQFPGPWQMQGQGMFTWSVFRVYRMALHVTDGYKPDGLFALDLNYLRNVSAAQITSASVDEMRRICASDEADLARWGEQLGRILPDVSLGDRLIGVFDPGKGVWFYSAHALLGCIDEPAFGPAFAAIWLDPSTRAPKLRAQLLGEAC